MQKQQPVQEKQLKHKFAVGQTVRLVPRPFEPAAQGTYKIVRQLPGEAGEFGYRVKSTSEVHERMVKESQLTR
jgi:hypothetical protein